jgi:hypothetical protein
MPNRIWIITAQLRAKVTPDRGTMSFDSVAVFRGNERTYSFRMAMLTTAFLSRFTLRGFHWLLTRPIAQRWHRRIAGIHAQPVFHIFDSLHPHHETTPNRRPALVPRILRNTIWFDQGCFAHERIWISSPISGRLEVLPVSGTTHSLILSDA